MTTTPTPNLDKVRNLNFDRLDDLVSERIAALKLYAQNIDKTSNADPATNDAICRDLILPCVYLLAKFLESVKVEVRE
jgi:hypothetical protein